MGGITVVRIRFDLLVAALVVALIVGSIAGHNAGVRAGAPLGGDPMAGTAAYGTILKLDGVAVAEVTSVTGPGMSRDVPDVSTHDSPEAWREALGNLKDPGEIAVEGKYLKGQMATLRAALDTDVPKTIQIKFPQGAGSWTFSGFLTALEGGHNVEEANSFSATIKLTGTPQEYWHCILAPTAPGTPPPEDPTHWEPVAASSVTLNPGESVFGQRDELTDMVGALSYITGTVFPFPSGAPTGSYTIAGVWPTWPNPGTLVEESTDHCYSIYGVVNRANKLVAIAAYLEYTGGMGGPTDTVKAAIYDAATGVLLGVTATAILTEGAPAAWVRMELADGPVLEAGKSYLLAVWGQGPSGMDSSLHGGALASYTRPDGEQWSPDEGYVFCETVYYKP